MRVASEKPGLLEPSPGSPAASGYRMPAEWEPHRSTWLVWPHNRRDWESKKSAIDWCYVEIIRHLIDGEGVCVLFQSREIETRACERLRRAGIDPGCINRYCIRTNRSWIRDSGPIFVARPPNFVGSSIAITSWRFNGWARYRSWHYDNRVPNEIARRLKRTCFGVKQRTASGTLPVVLEGGSIDVNGRGLLLTTEECLLGARQARNPGLTCAEIEQSLCDYLNARKICWLGQGILGDDTHGHVDDVARFVAPDVIVAASEADTNDENHWRLKDNLTRLKYLRTLRGKTIDVIEVPMPQPIFFEGERLPASYLNFYIGNRRVLVPTFNDPNDRIALNKFSKLFPDREIVGIHAVDLVLGLGTIHCLTQQEPAETN